MGTTSDKLNRLNQTKQGIKAFLVEEGENVSDNDSFYSYVGRLQSMHNNLKQYSTMPTASATNLNAIVQYIGTTDETYTNGHFYKCVEDNGSYSWTEIDPGSGVPANMVTTDTEQTITGKKWLNGGWSMGTAPNNPYMRTMSGSSMLDNYSGGCIEQTCPDANYRGIRYSHAGMTVINSFGTTLGGIERTNNTGNDGAFGVVKRNHSNEPYMAFNFNQVIITMAGDEIATNLAADNLFNGEIILCISDSSDVNTTYEAKHMYKFTYTNSEWVVTDIGVIGGNLNALAGKSEAMGSLALSIDSNTYIITLQAKDVNGNNLGNAQTIDLPIESVVVNGSYNNQTKKVILTLENGNTIEFSVADLVNGLQSEITSQDKLSADLIDDTSTTNKFVTSAEKTIWNSKQDSLGITAQDIQSAVAQISYLTTETTRLNDVKQDIMQYSIMPEPPDEDKIGQIVQYIGEDQSAVVQSGTFKNGHFYKSVASGNTYIWEEVELCDPPTNMVTTDTSQTITGVKTFTDDTRWRSGGTEKLYTTSMLPLTESTYNGGAIKARRFDYDRGTALTYGGIVSYNSSTKYAQVGWTSADGMSEMGYIRLNPLNQYKMVVKFSETQMAMTGDNIITKVTNNKLLNNSVITCIEDSTDANVSYQAKHTYKFNYENSAWTVTDITSTSAPTILTNTTASTWVADNTYADYGYKCVLNVSGVTANDYAEIVFGLAEAMSGNYAPISETGTGTITIYSKVNTSITIPTIKVDKV